MSKLPLILLISFVVSCSNGGGSDSTPGPADEDGDGVADVEDCQPTDPQLFKIYRGYVDADQDGFRSGTETAVCAGKEAPANIRAAAVALDCDDDNADRTITRKVYLDADGDTYTVGETRDVCSEEGQAPRGFTFKISTVSDCDDSNQNVWRQVSIRRDGDGDGYALGQPESACVGNDIPKLFIASDAAAKTDDCNDANSAEFYTQEVYEDKDEDGYTKLSPLSICRGESLPKGYNAQQSLIADCDDTQAERNKFVKMYRDQDKDGVATAEAKEFCLGEKESPPEQFAVKAAADCDDNNPEVSVNVTYYEDKDRDGISIDKSITMCVNVGSVVPEGYLLTSGQDCDDTNRENSTLLQDVYLDTDGDGYSDNDVKLTVCGNQNKFKSQTLGIDCAPQDPRTWSKQELYPDADGDGYYSQESQSVCIGKTIPLNYFKEKPTEGQLNPNDQDAQCKVLITVFKDNDEDGTGAGPAETRCWTAKDTAPFGYSIRDGDCNDSDEKVYRSYLGYYDEDGDQWGSTEEKQSLCIGKEAKVISQSEGLDCNDGIAEKQKIWLVYVDADKDGRTPRALVSEQCGSALTVPDGYLVLANPPQSEDLDPDDSVADCQLLQNVYADRDGDGFGSSELVRTCVGTSFRPSKGESLSNTDCNDQDSMVYRLLEGYRDQDGDSYGDSTAKVQICAGQKAPAGYSLRGLDCDDKKAEAFQSVFGFWDGDEDGYSRDTQAQTYCVGETSPVQNSSRGLDCNDSDKQLFQNLSLYRDKDQDGLVASPMAELVCSGQTPDRAFTASLSEALDPDDENADCRVIVNVFQDKDFDGVGTEAKSLCIKDPNVLPQGLSSKAGDCNDQDFEIQETQEFYTDSDGDGYPADATVKVLCGVRPGYVLRSKAKATIDSQDQDASCFMALPGFLDTDNDGVGAGAQLADVCEAGTYKKGYVTAGSDCAENDPSRFQIKQLYPDLDFDKEGDSTAVLAPVCVGTDIPQGYATSNGDCDDTTQQLIFWRIGYTDQDGDRFGTGEQKTVCYDPEAHVLSTDYRGKDCDDTDRNRFVNVSRYVDADRDGWGGTEVNAFCADNNFVTPTGFSENNADCNDQDAKVFVEEEVYPDRDGDTYTAEKTVLCMGEDLPQGYQAVANGRDCDDADASKHLLLPLYYDGDGDGVGQTKHQILCASRTRSLLPTGFSTLGYDLKDDDASYTDGGIDVEVNLLLNRLSL